MIAEEYLENLDCMSIDPRDYIDHASKLESLQLDSDEDRTTRRALVMYSGPLLPERIFAGGHTVRGLEE